MKIAITGARGTVGKVCVKVASEQGHHTIQINRTEEKQDPDIKNTEMRVADAANSYEDLVKAFKGADAIIHMAGIPNPEGKDDYKVHNNNTNASFNALRAAAELGIKRFCLASSVNAIGLAYANQPLVFDYFPIDEKYKQKPTDSYALAKMESEVQADSFVDWFRGMTIASMRIHQVEPRKTVQKEHEEQPESGITQLWGWVSPEATARACILSLESKKFEGRHEIFNIVAPDTTQSTPSKELAKKYYPNAEIRAGLEGNNGFWDTKKAKELLGWEHTEKE